MRSTITIVAILFLILQPALAQKLSKEFGVISKNEFEFKVYDKDPDAEAVVLFDVGKSVFFETDKGYDIRFTRTRRVKVLNRAGTNQAEVSIPFYVDGFGKSEKIVSIEAYTYNSEEGRLFKKSLDQSGVYVEKINDRWNAKKFVFPDVKEGSVIEYKYVLETPFHFNLPDWQFQDKIPTIYSEYTASLIPFYEYVFLAQGISKFDFQESKVSTEKREFGSVSEIYGKNVGSGFEFKDMIHTYVLKDVPAFKDESYITSPNDYLAKIDFQLAKFHSPRGGTTNIISTWPELTKELLKNDNFGKYTKTSERLAKKLLETEPSLGQGNDLEKSKQIIEYVKSSFSWNGYYSKFSSKGPKDFLNQKTGNAADINLFLVAMLRATGIDAQPVILSTRNHGKIKADYPFEYFFNYVIVLVNVNGQPYLADGTEALVAFNRIPPRCINEKGLVVKEDEVPWIDLYSSIQSVDSKTIALKLDPENLTAKTVVTVQSTEFEALGYRNLFKNDSIKIRENLLEDGFTNVSRVKTYNFDRTNLPYIIAYEGKTELEKIDNKIIISPFLHYPIKENILTQKKRSYPVDFIYPKKEKLISRLEIPAGYKLIGVPEAFTVDNELAEINLMYTIEDNIVEASAEYHFKKGVYISEEYARIKSYIDMIVKKFNEQLVFEKIGG
jgi:transglutaminase-like putative cysteine protease